MLCGQPRAASTHHTSSDIAVPRGFTLLELTAALACAAIVLSIAIPSFVDVLQRQKTAVAIRDLGTIAMAIQKYRLSHVGPPLSLADVNLEALRDPWGNPYCYLNFASGEPGINGKIRKDHNLHPINSEFDLYSMGPDGASRAALTASTSRDDILWARDGGFIGVATDF